MTPLETEPVRPPSDTPGSISRASRWRRLGSVEALAVVIIVGILARGWLLGLVDSPGALAFLTVFVSIMVQALPFLVLGTMLSAAITAFVPVHVFERALQVERTLQKRPVAALPVAAAAGVVWPTSERRSVPMAGALIRRGVAPAAAFAFLLSSPAINPIVLISTAVAFPNQPSMVVARFLASLAVAVIVGWLWLRFGQFDWLRPTRAIDPYAERGWPSFWASCQRDVVAAGNFLVVGALVAAVVNVAIPPQWLETIAGNAVFSVVALALLAVLLSICSEADAFVAASLSQFSLTARLTFLVVGPIVDVKLFALHVGSFGPRFAMRFALATLLAAIVVSAVIGWVIL